MEKEEIVALLNTVAIPTYQIEVNLGMPKTTLQKVLSGQRKKLPKKWSLKLKETYKPAEEVELPKPNKKKPPTIPKKPHSKKSNVKDDKTGNHSLWKEGDPKEGSMGFYMKYDCYTYEELQKLNP